MMYVWLVVIVFIDICESSGQLLWDDPASSDLHCTYPPAIGFPQHIFTAVSFTEISFYLSYKLSSLTICFLKMSTL